MMDKAGMEELKIQVGRGVFYGFLTEEDGAELVALIDAELARQVPDGEVQAAERCVVELIREAHKRNNESQYAHQEFIREYRDELRSAEKTILAALRQYRPEPTDGEIRAAIDVNEAIASLLGMREAVPEAVGKVRKELAGNQYVDVVAQAYQNRGYALDFAIAALRQYRKPVDGSTSDGHHTFDELYHHRAILFSSLCRAYPDKAWRSKKHSDGTMFGDNWFICGIETPSGQYSYHYKIDEYWETFACCEERDFAPEWDGHQPSDVDRLLSLRQYRKPEPWILVSERLPERYGHTLVRQKISVGEITEMAYYSNGGWMNCGKKIGVTHWMPLPEPPLGGDRA